MTTTTTRTLEQRRAAHALARVNAVAAVNNTRYRSYVESLPATIVMNGLGQAVATVLSNAGPGNEREQAYRLLHAHLQEWLCGDDPAAPYRGASDLIEAIVSGDHNDYLRAQAEALAYLVWLKKFAQAKIERGNHDD